MILEILNAPLENARILRNWGATLCVAPHPDDESLGCGGTLALLAQNGAKTGVVWVSDGALSHPNSRQFPREKLIELRQKEAQMAAQKLGLKAENLFFQKLPDGHLPFPDEADFASAVVSARAILAQFAPQTLLLPWRRDPHRDHRASWLIWAHAAQNLNLQRLEYLVWAFERAGADEWPQNEEARAFRLDISTVLPQKIAAIESHASQTTRLIDDDPTAFWLSPAVLAHFQTPFESWIAPHQNSPQRGWAVRPQFEQ